MRRTCLAIGLLLSASPLLALNARSAVSLNGMDTNPCTPASPCRSFNTAIAATLSGGEVIALDSAGYGPFTVSMPLAISGAPGVHAALSVPSGNGIGISAGASDTIIIRNLVLIGAGGAVGIDEISAQEVIVIGCLIRGFSTNGVTVETTASDLTVQGSSIIQNSGNGITQKPGGGIHRIVIADSVLHYNNAGVVLAYQADAVITDSNLSDNFADGVQLDGTLGVGFVSLKRCTVVGCYIGVEALTANANVYLSQNVIAFNITGVRNMGTSYTFSNNRIGFNVSFDVSASALIPQALQ